MKVLVTGAAGFLGRYVVAAAVRCGHSVRALVRPASKTVPPSWIDHPQVEVVCGDLRARRGIGTFVAGVDVVIHLAATKEGDLYEQFAGTVIATENLLDTMDEEGVRRLVVTSSFSVYEYLHRWGWSVLDESSPLADEPRLRDEYCQTKLVQERVIRDWCDRTPQGLQRRAVILRPGAIFGRDNLWTGRIGTLLGNGWCIRTGAMARIPLSYVENCADAAVAGAENRGPDRLAVLNIVDDEQPSQRRYLSALRKHMAGPSHVIPVPWIVIRLLARLAWLTNAILFRGTAKVPGLFVPARLHARCKPLRYTNAKAVSVLGWRPRFSWREGLERACGKKELVALLDPPTAAVVSMAVPEESAL